MTITEDRPDAAPRHRGPILWYVHHDGAGHWRRALAVVRQLSRDVVMMSSAQPPGLLPENARFLPLPPDYPAGEAPAERAAAGGVLHWAPPHHRGLLTRHSAILAQAARVQPSLAVVDVSVEVAVLLRTSGVPVIAVRLPGDRSDPAHRLGFDLADEVLMPVPAKWGLHSGLARTVSVGLVSALDPEPASAIPPNGPVVVLAARGGHRLDRAVCAQIAADLPERRIRVLGHDRAHELLAHSEPADPSNAPIGLRGGLTPNLDFAGRVADPSAALATAAVVVTNGGLGALADSVRAGRPLIVLPEERPYGEQHATASALAAGGDAVVLAESPPAGGWRAVIEQAVASGAPRLLANGARNFANRVERRALAEDALRPVMAEHRHAPMQLERRGEPVVDQPVRDQPSISVTVTARPA
jgi:UDP-N-acetylglucosamine--N-acetylmuramyl-(pentapeptide) pyrophosphoryl-undecaprenol N-acetylglucosamine transferase